MIDVDKKILYVFLKWCDGTLPNSLFIFHNSHSFIHSHVYIPPSHVLKSALSAFATF
jgi:hypothetical protein